MDMYEGRVEPEGEGRVAMEVCQGMGQQSIMMSGEDEREEERRK